MNTYRDNLKKIIKENFIKLKRKIMVNNFHSISLIDIDKIIVEVIDENPQIFYISEWQSSINNEYICIVPIYTYAHKYIKETRLKCTEQKDIIIKKTYGLTEYEKVKIIHDTLVKNIEYEVRSSKDVHNIDGPLIKRKAVCDGFAKLFKYIMDEIGIPCIYVKGRSFGNNLSSNEVHAWNMVNIYSEWFHIDVTFDATIYEDNFIRYDYFLIDDDLIQVDHYYDKSIYPNAYNKRLNPYEDKRIYMENKSDLVRYINNQLNQDNYRFMVKLPQKVNKNTIEESILNVVLNTLQQNNIYARVIVSYSFNRYLAYIDIER